MRLLLLFLFLAYPLLEIALMIKVGGMIGLWPLLGIVVCTGFAGAMALQRHGFTMLQRMTEEMAAGRPPVRAMLEGALMAAAGLLLIAPGLITDALGLALLVPPLRRWIAGRLSGGVLPGGATFGGRQPGDDATPTGAIDPDDPSREADTFGRHGSPRDGAARQPRTPIVIEGEFERIEERTVDPKNGGRPPRTPAND